MKKKNLLFTAIAILGFATMSFAQVPSYVPTSGLVGWWQFNGNAGDSSINGNNGTVNGATLTTDRFGNPNSAYSFNGVNDYINTPNSASLSITSDITMSAWILDNGDSNDYHTILGKRNNSGYWSYNLSISLINGGTGQEYKKILSGRRNPPSTADYKFSGDSINTLIWQHVAVTVKTDTINFYLNGNNVGYVVATGNVFTIPVIDQSVGLTIGACNSPTEYFWGKLDDIGIWNRALTTTEISALYNGCSASVTIQPINQSVNISNNAQFTTASSDSMATYQWQTDLGFGYISFNSIGQYSGTANDTLTIVNTTLTNNNQPFRCIVSTGCSTDTSAVAVLTVLCNISVTTQPINQSVNISNNAQFTTASSDPLATYQWQTDLGVGYLNLNSVGQYSGTINDTLTITNTTLSNNNQPFRCIISSGSCTDTSNVAVLTVINNVGINEFTQDNLFSVYPNPANSQINVKVDSKLLESVYNVYNNTGKLVLTGKIISENTTIELGNLSGGIYLFSVGENMKQTFKVIKE